jgi:hypothetical protein
MWIVKINYNVYEFSCRHEACRFAAYWGVDFE